MFTELLFSLILGIMFGIFTGLIPGIHVNLVAALLLALSSFLLKMFTPLDLAVFIISLSVTHSFLDTIPSIYLGAPENENALSILPGQKMLLAGYGHMAVKITILGTYVGMITAILLVPLFIFSAEKIFTVLRPYLGYLLFIIMFYLIVKDSMRLWNLFLFLLAGTLGVLVFSVPNLNEPLFPMLSGLFGVSGLMVGIFDNTKIPKQNITSKINLKLSELVKAVFASSVGVFFIQFFPGLGPAQGAVLSNVFIRDIKDKGYLALVGAMGTMSVVFSLVTFYTLGKAKDGSIVVVSKLLEIDKSGFILLLSSFLIAGSISVFLTLYFSKMFSKLIVRVNYQILVITIIVFIFLMSFFLNGPLGIVVLITATAIGLIAPLKGIGRNHLMGCLILPVMLYYVL